MILNVMQKDLFAVDEMYYLAHCISADYALGAGIAVQFDYRFDMRRRLNETGNGGCPDCLLIGKTFNLVTKKRSFYKPTYESLQAALYMMKTQAIEKGIMKIAMPLIGCGLDGLQWNKVQGLLRETFSDTDIEILVCFRWEDRRIVAIRPQISEYSEKEFPCLLETRVEWFKENFHYDVESGVFSKEDCSDSGTVIYTQIDGKKMTYKIYGDVVTGFVCIRNG